eukprot:3696244-Rhodomonas_salina.1
MALSTECEFLCATTLSHSASLAHGLLTSLLSSRVPQGVSTPVPFSSSISQPLFALRSSGRLLPVIRGVLGVHRMAFE